MTPNDIIRSRFPQLRTRTDDYLDGWCDALLECPAAEPAEPKLWRVEDGTVWLRESEAVLSAWRTGAGLVGRVVHAQRGRS